MKSYLALVAKDTDGAFGVRFPDIPGCFSAADETEQVVPNAAEALQLWAGDMPVPPRSEYEAIVSWPDVREALAQCAYLISVPMR